MSKPSTPTLFENAGMKSAGCVAAALILAAAAMIAFGTGAHGKTAKAAAKPASTLTATSAVSDQQRVRARASLSALPLAFEANQGQSDPQVKYMARGNGYTLFLTQNDAVFAVRSGSGHTSAAGKSASQKLRQVRAAEKSAAIHMQMLGGNSQAVLAAGSEVPGTINYYIGNDPTKWQQGVKQYSAVTYREVYPGVNVAFHGQQRQLEFDFIVAPGASAAPIDLGFKGASKIATDATGNLVLSSAAGDVLLHKPVAYQEKDGQRQLVNVSFQTNAANQIGFAVGSYDHSRALVIDPSVTYATYLGGNGDDEAYAVAVDGSGNAYVTGETKSATFGGKSAGPNFDVFVSELNPAASSLVYTSIFSASGGSAGDCSGNAIAVDGSGNAYVGGSATAGFPTTSGTAQTAFGGGALDGFVLKVAPSTGALVYSTYLGGSGRDVVNGLTVDTASPANVYVAGDTFSTDFPGTGSSTIQSALAGTDDNGFVTKLNGTGAALVYSTYLGGAGANLGNAIALDGSNNAYVTGLTESASFPTTSGAFHTTFGGVQNAFATEVNAAGSSLVYSTYLGGSGNDEGLGIAVDSAGEAYVAGSTSSSNFPTLNAAQSALGGSSATNVFLSKLNSSGSALVFSTYYGGSLEDAGTAVALDTFGDAYVTGRATSSNYPVSNAFQSSLAGTSAAIVTEFSSGGSVEYSSYFGGSATQNGVGGADGNGPIGGIAVDASSNAYIAGDTTSSSGLATTGTYQTSYGGAVDAFVAKIGPAPADFALVAAPASTSVTSGQTTSAITVTVSSVNASFGQSVALACSNLPSHAACQFSNASVTPGSTPGTSNLTISTNGSSSASMTMPGAHGRLQAMAAILLPLVGVALIGSGMSNRKQRILGMLMLAVVLASLMILPACGGSSNNGGGGGGGTTTSPGTYTISVTGTSGSTTHSTSVTLTVN